MEKFVLPKSNSPRGFTLLETVVALIIAASGLAVVFQSISGAARLQATALELSKTQMVAARVLTEAQSANLLEFPSSGKENGIAWTIQTDLLGEAESGMQLFRIRVLAAGATGREVQLISETLRGQP